MSLHQRLSEVFKEVESNGGWVTTGPFFTKVSFGEKQFGEAAVLCCIRERNDRLELLLSKRSEALSSHKGEVCLPGGRREDGDYSLVMTALREAKEEVNLLPHQVQVVGTLPPVIGAVLSRSVLVTPVLATLTKSAKDDLKLTPNEEVTDIFWVPLDLFLFGGPHHTKMKFYFNAYKDHYIDDQFSLAPIGKKYIVWGLTGAISIAVSSITLQAPVRYPFMINVMSEVDRKNNCGISRQLVLPYQTSINRIISKL